MSEREPIRVGDTVVLRFSTATWEVVAVEDGKEGEGKVYVLRPLIGTERVIRTGVGAIRPESVRRPER